MIIFLFCNKCFKSTFNITPPYFKLILIFCFVFHTIPSDFSVVVSVVHAYVQAERVIVHFTLHDKI